MTVHWQLMSAVSCTVTDVMVGCFAYVWMLCSISQGYGKEKISFQLKFTLSAQECLNGCEGSLALLSDRTSSSLLPFQWEWSSSLWLNTDWQRSSSAERTLGVLVNKDFWAGGVSPSGWGMWFFISAQCWWENTWRAGPALGIPVWGRHTQRGANPAKASQLVMD